MKKTFYILSLFSVMLLFSCSKEDDTSNSSGNDNYKENKELVLPGSTNYFIADVYINGVHKKINMQSATNNCSAAWGKRFCNAGQSHREYYGILRDRNNNNPNYKLKVGFRGECPPCSFSNLVTKDLNNFTHIDQDLEGLFLTFSTIPSLIDSSHYSVYSKNYSTGYTPLNMQENSEFNLIELIEEGANGDTKFIIANFDCTLVNDQLYNSQTPNSGGVIEIKNAVLRSRIGS